MIGFACVSFSPQSTGHGCKGTDGFSSCNPHTHTLRPLSGSQFMSLSPSPHEDVDVHYVYEPSHTGNVLNLLSRLPPFRGLDPSDDVKNLHLYLQTPPMTPSEDQFLLSCVCARV